MSLMTLLKRAPVIQPLNLLPSLRPTFQTGWNPQRATLSPNASAAPDGSFDAATLVEDGTVTSTHYADLPADVVAKPSSALTYRMAIWAKRLPGSPLGREIALLAYGSGYADNAFVVTDFVNRSVRYTDHGAAMTVQQSYVEYGRNDWTRYVLDFTSDATAGLTMNCQVVSRDGAYNYSFSYSGDSASGVVVWGAGLWKL